LDFLVADEDDYGAPKPDGSETKDDACPDIEVEEQIIARVDEVEAVGAEGGEGSECAEKSEKNERTGFRGEDVAGFGKLRQCANEQTAH